MFLIDILGKIMLFCYNLFNNYGIAIILFTLFSKIVLLPISIWIQKNSIKMVKMQPEINKIKINYFGDKDRIAEEQSKVYKREKYNAFASLIPLFVQILLLLGLVKIINQPITYILNIDNEVASKAVQVALDNNESLEPESSSLEVSVVKDIHNDANIEKYKEVMSEEDLQKIKNFDMKFCGFDLGWIATVEKGIAIWIPIIAGLSALVLCVGQNIMNVLQAEQSAYNKYGMLILSVGLSLYLGAFVPAGVALYWTFSNLFAVLQQWLLNIFINPKKHVDYEELEKTGKQLKELEDINKKNGKRTPEQRKKEKEDYKRFFSIVNKHLVFYSESNGFYKYYKSIIEYLLENTNITIHYITSDYNDKIFEMEKQNSQIKAYYIEEKKLITLMMQMDADAVVMTMPDIENYHIKRSYVRKDIDYVYIPHGMDSINLTMRTCSTNHYDTVFVTGKYQKEEQEKTNEVYNLKNRKLIDWGYTLLDDMIADYEKNKVVNEQKTVLIAPSWQKDNIVDLCLDEILDSLKEENLKVIVRPHPQHVRHMKDKFENMKEQFKDNKNIEIQTDFSSNSTVFNADLLITDWSGIAFEYAYTTKKPVLFVDTPMKVMNPDYKKIDVEPFNIWARNEIGQVVPVEECKDINKVVNQMLEDNLKYNEKINKLVNESVYNLGNSAEVGAKYIINSIQEKINERKKEN
ncbi:MAG: membrane protein insertase YidC [Clostridia bacterium]|nr:membrane protein insertase YidC [Clostridia bacterium]